MTLPSYEELANQHSWGLDPKRQARVEARRRAIKELQPGEVMRIESEIENDSPERKRARWWQQVRTLGLQDQFFTRSRGDDLYLVRIKATGG